MSIRVAAAGDLERVLEIEHLSFEKTWDRTKLETALQEVFLLYEEEEVLGFLIACCREVLDEAVILKIAVHPDHRGRRIATRLIEAALERFRDMRIRDVELHVDIVARGAIRLYEKFGFRIFKVLTADYEENEAFYMMKLKLAYE
jgi:ribosomal-protein-alanine N-acetyltransferase